MGPKEWVQIAKLLDKNRWVAQVVAGARGFCTLGHSALCGVWQRLLTGLGHVDSSAKSHAYTTAFRTTF